MVALNETPAEPTLAQQLAMLLNRHNQENESSTPDFILADYMLGCLDAYNKAMQARSNWYS